MLTLSHQTHFSFCAEDMLDHFMVKHTACLQYQQPIGLFSARLAKHLISVMIFWLYASLFQASEWLQTWPHDTLWLTALLLYTAVELWKENIKIHKLFWKEKKNQREYKWEYK